MTQLDDELAEATDTLLSGRDLKPLDGENRDLDVVLRQLVQVIDPKTPPSAAYQQRLTNRLTSEWDRAYAPPTLRLLDRPLVRLVSLAAAVVLLLGAILVLAVPNNPQPLQGTAIGLNHTALAVVLLVLAASGAFFYWRHRR